MYLKTCTMVKRNNFGGKWRESRIVRDRTLRSTAWHLEQYLVRKTEQTESSREVGRLLREKRRTTGVRSELPLHKGSTRVKHRISEELEEIHGREEDH